MARQAEDAVERARAITELQVEWQHAMAGTASKTPASLVELLAENPYWTLNGVAQRLDIAFTTAGRAVNKLVDAGILIEVSGGKRDRVYCAEDILEVLERPARLTPAT